MNITTIESILERIKLIKNEYVEDPTRFSIVLYKPTCSLQDVVEYISTKCEAMNDFPFDVETGADERNGEVLFLSTDNSYIYIPAKITIESIDNINQLYSMPDLFLTFYTTDATV